MRIAALVSGTGTNFEKIYEAPQAAGNQYFVFSNVPGCGGIMKAHAYGVPHAELDSVRFFKEKYGLDRAPRLGPERDAYDKTVMGLIGNAMGTPDLICLAGYELWLGEWLSETYYGRILNVHPGDSRKYDGLGWVPTAKAILNGEESVRSTVFFVDKGDDTGPVLIQSAPLPLPMADADPEIAAILELAVRHDARTLREFKAAAESDGRGLYGILEGISSDIQDILKKEGDWKIYPFAVHELIGQGRTELRGRDVYIDGRHMPDGWQLS